MAIRHGVLIACVFCPLVATDPIQGPMAFLADGKAVGVALSGGVRGFFGLPFAEPPIGGLRWRRPVSNRPWGNATYNATQVKPQCLQAKGGDEDCLYLNVFAPAACTKKSSCAVMFWIYGGGYVGGSAIDEGGQILPQRHGVILVSANYRLNIFGFLGSSELRARATAGGGTGNYGLLDQRMAMVWVQRNIASIGGDPSRVFIVGESAGAGSVTNHVIMPGSWGLFSRAGMESGSFSQFDSAFGMEQAEGTYACVLKYSRCANTDCLLKLASSELADIAQKVIAACSKAEYYFQPSIDGVDIVGEPWKLARSGIVAPNVTFLFGSNREDAVPTHIPLPTCTHVCSEQDFRSWLNSTLSYGHVGLGVANASQIAYAMDLYSREPQTDPSGPYRRFSKWYWASKHVLSDTQKLCSARRAARWLSKKAATYLYWFTRVATTEWGTGDGCYHGAEIFFVFGWVFSGVSEELQLSSDMGTFWTNMAIHGYPSSDKSWPKYDKADDVLLQMDVASASSGGLKPVAHVRTDFCDFWDTLLYQSDPSASTSMMQEESSQEITLV